MRILCTGGSGFMGSHVAERILELGHSCTIIDRKRTNLRHLKKKVRFISGDVRNWSDCLRALHKVDVVIHLAALINVDHSIKTPSVFWDHNVLGTITLLDAINSLESVKKMVYMSCYDEETRVFTKNGLKYYFEIQKDDFVLSMNIDT